MTVHTAPMQPDEVKVELRATIRRQRQQRAERRLAEREYLPPVGPYESYVAEEGSGYDDVSEEHDRHLADRE